MTITRPLFALTALLLAGPAVAQTATAPITPPVAMPATPHAATIPADPALWVVKDKDTTVYLFGTVHALKPHLGWFDSAVRKAFDSSGQLMLEIPLPDPATAQRVMLPLATDTSGVPLTQKLPAGDRAAYAAAMTRLGIPPAALEKFEPWFVAVTLSQLALQKAGFSAADGAEAELTAAATAQRKPVAGLETLQQQLGYFHNLSQADQVAFLVSSVQDIDKFDGMINAMLDRWKAGDAEGLSALMNEDLTSQPNLYRVLLVERNKRWATWIAQRMKKPGTVFIAVGAGHLAGRDSVQTQLAKYRLKAVRIRY
ncbi:TraB/GumN family protein [Sphingomonas sp. PAMC 26621]|uniref:TraB/GumN family protein n=1 Tax=Sphingomonas sp. PAMC 26621 TaxID=1112213 RepID=UPI0002886A7F|nr:TraB/GumN family protein [Sphingomonas sp. PAMC 26621]